MHYFLKKKGLGKQKQSHIGVKLPPEEQVASHPSLSQGVVAQIFLSDHPRQTYPALCVRYLKYNFSEVPAFFHDPVRFGYLT
jgi:hypothetical protein